ncbi:MAG: YIP1 family protein [Bacillota bacterium]
MKKIWIFLILFSFVFLFTQAHLSVNATGQLTNYGIPYQTYTLSSSDRLIPTQTAYIPVGVLGSNLGLSAPEDIFYIDNELYIADTGNKRIIKIDASGNLIKIYEFPEFKSPTGIFVKGTYLYVADKVAKAVFQIDLDTVSIAQTILKPISPIYGQQNDFVPTKVAVDSSDSIYIIGEGSTSGVIQVNYAGEFVGYLGINTVPLSLRKILYNFFVQDSELASSTPPSPTNLALGAKGSILTTNANVRETFKRLNISGINTLFDTTVYPAVGLSDIWMNHENYIYLIADTGEVYEYDSNGNMLFYFNTNDNTMTQTLGLTSQPKGIITDFVGNLYILDKGYNSIQVYQRTVFVDLVHEAVTMYNDGKYVESKPIWEEIIRQNSSFALAHSALGSALAKEGKYEAALSEFFDAKDYKGYSDTYWEIRNVVIQDQLGTWIISLLAIYILWKVLGSVFRKSPAYDIYLEKKKKILSQKLTSEVVYSLNVIKQPNDMFFGIKRYNSASYLSGFIVFFLFILVYLINIYATGFLFRDTNLNNVLIELSIVIGIFFLYVVVNYLVSTLNDGEGRFKDVLISTSYVLVPFIIFTLPMTILSNYLTYNETFIFTFYHQIILVWTIILIVLSIKSVHNYTFWETVKNILIIIFGMFILIFIGLLIYSFLGQLIEFVISIIKEVIYRV